MKKATYQLKSREEKEIEVQNLMDSMYKKMEGYTTNVDQVGVPSANGEFVSIRRFPLISPVILYNKECFQNNSKNQLDNSGN
ncbi:TPA: hypothetical protein LR817_002816 [Listeria monocytogenes]|nr:hypothetical protein [Listeria monocytogenes]HBL8141443.1 hypothetical protein [Listeria monocytogenes]HCW3204470.1 hypothetical protein [Listeria monocytogenes]HCW3227659.1 hypothetical protein [Listeria monocytogenes]